MVATVCVVLASFVVVSQSSTGSRAAAAGSPTPITVTAYDTNRAFTPNGPQENTISGEYVLSDAANVTITVADSTGTVVRTLQSAVSESAGGRDWTWDGTNDGGTTVPDGLYDVTVHAVDANGTSADGLFHTQVITEPIGQLSAPTAGSTVSGTIDYDFVPNAAYTVTAVSFPCATGVVQGDGSWQGSANSASCFSNGANTVAASVSWTDSFGYTHYDSSPSVPITVSNAITVTAYDTNRAFTPNGPQENTISGEYVLSDAANVTITVADSTGTVVRTLQSAVSESAGGRDWTWDGTNDGGTTVPDGLYDVTVHAVDANGTSADGLFHTQVITEPIGQLSAPTAGSTVSGTIDYDFVPNAAYTVTAVSFPCATGVVQGDGSWQGTAAALSCFAAGRPPWPPRSPGPTPSGTPTPTRARASRLRCPTSPPTSESWSRRSPDRCSRA